MIRKVMGSEDLLRAAGTVTKKLSGWLGTNSYIDETSAKIATERSADAVRDLPAVERLARLLYEASERSTIDTGDLSDDDYIDDYLVIDRVEPEALWFEGDVGPVAVSPVASAVARPGWSVNIVLGRSGNGWQILEVGNVYP